MAKEVKIEGLEALLERMKALPIEARRGANSPLRFGTLKAANVVRDRARELAPKDSGKYAKGIRSKWRGKYSGEGVLRYDVAPFGNMGLGIALEHGTGVAYDGERIKPKKKKVLYNSETGIIYGASSRGQSAQPHMRPAFYSAGVKAIEVFTIEAGKKLDRLIQKLAMTRGK